MFDPNQDRSRVTPKGRDIRCREIRKRWRLLSRNSLPIRLLAMGRERIDARMLKIFLFKTLTSIRRGGRSMPAGILNAGGDEPLIDLATRTSSIRLADRTA